MKTRMGEPANAGVLTRAHFLENALFAAQEFFVDGRDDGSREQCCRNRCAGDVDRAADLRQSTMSIDPAGGFRTGDRDRAVQMVRNLERSSRVRITATSFRPKRRRLKEQADRLRLAAVRRAAFDRAVWSSRFYSEHDYTPAARGGPADPAGKEQNRCGFLTRLPAKK